MVAEKKKLEIAMARRCMNTGALQKATNMPRPTINNVLSGRSVSPATLGKVAKALKVDVVEILAGEEPARQ